MQRLLGAQGPGLRGTMKRLRHWSKGRLALRGMARKVSWRYGQEGTEPGRVARRGQGLDT